MQGRTLTRLLPVLGIAILLVMGVTMVSAHDAPPVPLTAIGDLPGDGPAAGLREVTAPDATYYLSGTVTDARTGWAIMATVTYTPPGESPVTIWNDPWTGAYAVELAPAAYDLEVTPWAGIAGYVSQTRSTTVAGDTVEDFALETPNCDAPGYDQHFETDFDAVTVPALPTAWVAESVNGSTGTWKTAAGTVNPAGESPVSAPNLVYLNSWTTDPGDTARLYTAQGVDMTAVGTPKVTFQMFHEDEYSSRDDRVQVQVSANGGAWLDVGAPVSRYDGSYGWGEHTVDLSAYASATNLRIGFLGISDYGNDVHMDDIRIGGCDAPPGALLAGTVYDSNNSDQLTGARVWNSLGDYAEAQETPGDNYFAESFYVLYLPPGSQTVTATMTRYEDKVVYNYPVAVGETNPQDLFMEAGYPSVTPLDLDLTLTEGLTTSRRITLTNANDWVAYDYALDWDEGWLSTSSVTGTVASSGQVVVEVGFDSAHPGLTGPGVYTDTLIVRHTTPYPDVQIAVTMTVAACVYLPLVVR